MLLWILVWQHICIYCNSRKLESFAASFFLKLFREPLFQAFHELLLQSLPGAHTYMPSYRKPYCCELLPQTLAATSLSTSFCSSTYLEPFLVNSWSWSFTASYFCKLHFKLFLLTLSLSSLHKPQTHDLEFVQSSSHTPLIASSPELFRKPLLASSSRALPISLWLWALCSDPIHLHSFNLSKYFYFL